MQQIKKKGIYIYIIEKKIELTCIICIKYVQIWPIHIINKKVKAKKFALKTIHVLVYFIHPKRIKMNETTKSVQK